MIVFESVTKVYEPDVVALRDVTFHIDKGEFVFIVGASGSGKSTLIRLLLKELEPSNGRIIVGNRDLGRLKRSDVPPGVPTRGRLRMSQAEGQSRSRIPARQPVRTCRKRSPL